MVTDRPVCSDGTTYLVRSVLWSCGVWLFVGSAVAATGSMDLSSEPVSVPWWLVLSTGGGVIGASFLITSFVTDRETIRSVTALQWFVPRWLVPRFLSSAIRLASVVVLVIVVGCAIRTSSVISEFAILFVWSGWWAGYTMSVYLVGNTWPTLNPWRTIASVVTDWVSIDRSLPQRLGVWPSVGGLLGSVWLTMVTPVTTSPRLLAAVIIVYSLLTIAGGVVYGVAWFRWVDPIARLFRAYGRVAPFQRVSSGIELTIPGSELTEGERGRGEPTFIIAVLWVTTYDGLVSTPLWRELVQAAIAVGIPPAMVYALGMGGGFGAFLFVYRAGVRSARRTGRTYVTVQVIEQRFARSLLPIAVSYHFAHYLGSVLGLLAVLAGVLSQPFGGLITLLPRPSWFGPLQLLSILCGHLLAVWVAHTTAFDLFTGRFQSIRSQYPFILMMIAYTMIGMWIVLQPSVRPPVVT
ncbi:hypothetical protein [Halocatena salina]|uniref:Uncharacterized protein n=1 Tax=Halocatena salina TaxID=2934340 RepID=A0A8U0A0A2_9EURY|nr:hypothetical protein [Halocatena salina]UPM42551.1 hypothetical protein MW046_11380 [Halocatena salina]